MAEDDKRFSSPVIMIVVDKPLLNWTRTNLANALGANSGLDLTELDVSPLPVEASHRRFYRVSTQITEQRTSSPQSPKPQELSYVVMDSPPTLENNESFVHLARLFAANGIGVPQIAALDKEQGYFLMTDLGDTEFIATYGSNRQSIALNGAIQVLQQLQQIHSTELEVYTQDRFVTELGIFDEWFVERLLHMKPPKRVLQPLYALLVGATEEQPQVCVHRDFHCRNLLLDSDDRVGVVDFQDALIGPVAYDLASLLHDCYYHFETAQITHYTKQFIDLSDLPLNFEQLTRWRELCAIQRQLKAVGIFTRLWLRDQKHSHLQHILPVLAQLIELCNHHELGRPVAQWLTEITPQTEKQLITLGRSA